MIGIEHLTARAAQAKGAELLRGPARPPLPGTLRLLFGERRGVRRGVAPRGQRA